MSQDCGLWLEKTIRTHITKSHFVRQNNVCGCSSNKPLLGVLNRFFIHNSYTHHAVGDEDEGD